MSDQEAALAAQLAAGAVKQHAPPDPLTADEAAVLRQSEIPATRAEIGRRAALASSAISDAAAAITEDTVNKAVGSIEAGFITAGFDAVERAAKEAERKSREEAASGRLSDRGLQQLQADLHAEVEEHASTIRDRDLVGHGDALVGAAEPKYEGGVSADVSAEVSTLVVGIDKWLAEDVLGGYYDEIAAVTTRDDLSPTEQRRIRARVDAYVRWFRRAGTAGPRPWRHFAAEALQAAEIGEQFLSNETGATRHRAVTEWVASLRSEFDSAMGLLRDNGGVWDDLIIGTATPRLKAARAARKAAEARRAQ